MQMRWLTEDASLGLGAPVGDAVCLLVAVALGSWEPLGALPGQYLAAAAAAAGRS